MPIRAAAKKRNVHELRVVGRFTRNTKLSGRLHAENLDLQRLLMRKKKRCLSRSHGPHDFLRLISQFKEMFGMAPLMPPEAFACGHDHGTAQAQAFRRMHEPLGQRLVIEATMWLHKKVIWSPFMSVLPKPGSLTPFPLSALKDCPTGGAGMSIGRALFFPDRF